MKTNLPTISELYNSENQMVLSKQNDLNILLNQEPKSTWVKPHPIAKKKVDGKQVPVEYLPIGRVEWLLTNLFVKWRVELIREGLIANSAYCTIRLHYLDPVTNEWDYQDGIGACPLQTDADASATDWTRIKTDAVMKALPAAKSYAIKDAAEHLGKLFGKDLNRADEIGYDTLQGKFNDAGNLKELIDLIDKVPKELQLDYKNKLKKLKSEGQLSDNIILSMIADIKSRL